MYRGQSNLLQNFGGHFPDLAIGTYFNTFANVDERETMINKDVTVNSFIVSVQLTNFIRKVMAREKFCNFKLRNSFWLNSEPDIF